MSQYSIKDLETFTGIKAHTIRIWEKRYSVVEPDRTATNIRTYDDEDLKRLLNISILNRHGYRISDIMKLNADEISEKVIQISKKSTDNDSQIENLVVAMIELNEERFEKTLTQSIIRSGFEETVQYLIYPFYERIGVLWQAGSIVPAQEHFISNLIRQKIIVAIDSITAPRKADAKNLLLFLPEGEWHETGLLFCHYLLKKWGHRVIYLGQNVPFENLDTILNRCPVDFFIGQFITGITKEEFESQLFWLAEKYPGQQFLLSGLQVREKTPHLPENFKSFHKVEELKEIIENQA